jgi:glycogen operon protein
MKTRLATGQCYPLGANFRPGGVNFCLYSESATAVELHLFDDPDDAKPSRIIALDPHRNKTFYYWHVRVPDLQVGQLYGFKVRGPFDPSQGQRFDGDKLLLDPYARTVIAGKNYSRKAASHPGDNSAQALKSVVVDSRAYDWEDDLPLGRPLAGSLIYEMHVGGFTRNPNSGVTPARRGTFAGLVDKILYLQELGVTAVELLPVQHFDQEGNRPELQNYWGYQPIAFFAPHRGYSSNQARLGPVDEFRDMVKALHLAGIEVILDVVFNHSAEGNENGPTFSFRGLENRTYYILDDHGGYANYSGTGNTNNGNQSIVRRLILDCLRYWVRDMHVDGFRFDLASVLARDEWGQPLRSPPILWDIESDPVLAGTKIIAEAWDAGGLYQLGTFVGHRWAEWNGQFRDDVRRFVKGDDGTVERLALRLQGSPDLFPTLVPANTEDRGSRVEDRGSKIEDRGSTTEERHIGGRSSILHPRSSILDSRSSRPSLPQLASESGARVREPERSINFVTCHDGFTLNDLVSYNQKHNESNGEDNRDGTDANYSWNCGTEGPTDDPAIEALRKRQIKNFLTILFISQGTPMVLMGDEIRRSQQGNNNAYCQNNQLSWFDWQGVRQDAEIVRFTRGLIRLNRDHSLSQAVDSLGRTTRTYTWHGVHLNQPDWSWDSHSLAFSLSDEAFAGEEGGRGEVLLHFLLNAYWEPLQFELPTLPVGKRWRRAVGTALPSPDDYHEPGTEPALSSSTYQAEERSAVVLIAR